MIKIFMSVQCLKKITGSKLWQFLFPKFAMKKVIVVKTEFPKELIMNFLKKNTEPMNLLRYTDANMFMSPSKKVFEGEVKRSSFYLSINKGYDPKGLRFLGLIDGGGALADAYYKIRADIKGTIKSDGEGSLLELKIIQSFLSVCGYYFFVALRLLFGVAAIGILGLIVLSCIIGLYENLFLYILALAFSLAFFIAIGVVLKRENLDLEKMEKLFLKLIEGKKIADADSHEKGNDA